MFKLTSILFFFFFNDTATTEIYTLSLHDALPILARDGIEQVDTTSHVRGVKNTRLAYGFGDQGLGGEVHHGVNFVLREDRSEEHTSELQSQSNLVCRLLLEKKKHSIYTIPDDRLH